MWKIYFNCTRVIFFNKNYDDINGIIEFISSIRSTKAELKVTPKLFCDISFSEKSSKLNLLVKKNITLVKQVGRINNILQNNEKIYILKFITDYANVDRESRNRKYYFFEIRKEL